MSFCKNICIRKKISKIFVFAKFALGNLKIYEILHFRDNETCIFVSTLVRLLYPTKSSVHGNLRWSECTCLWSRRIVGYVEKVRLKIEIHFLCYNNLKLINFSQVPTQRRHKHIDTVYFKTKDYSKNSLYDLFLAKIIFVSTEINGVDESLNRQHFSWAKK